MIRVVLERILSDKRNKKLPSTKKFNKFYPSENTAGVIKLWGLKCMGHK
jgi:hypothetical protein